MKNDLKHEILKEASDKNKISLNRNRAEKFIDSQSTRTSFKMQEKIHEDLNWIITYDKSTAKKVLGHIVDSLWKNKKLTKAIAKHFEKSDSTYIEKDIRKTYVIGRRSLRRLKELAQKNQVNRDTLLEAGIIVFKTKIDEIIVKNRKAHEKALEYISELWSQSTNLLEKLKTISEEDDPIIERLWTIDTIIMNLHEDVLSELNEGTPIDPEGL